MILQRLNSLDTSGGRADSPSMSSPSLLHPPVPAPPATPIPHPKADRDHAPKPATPSDFDGDRTKGRAFINSCVLYMTLCKDKFSDEQVKIHWVLSYMKSGRAATFADRVIRREERLGLDNWSSFADFLKEFSADFCPEDEATTARMKLEGKSYFQGRRNVDCYVDEFRNLVDYSGYTEAINIVIKFRRGLAPAIQDKIAESGSDRPADYDIKGWYAAARRLDRNRIANEAFHSASSSSKLPLSSSSSGAVPGRSFFSRTNTSVTPNPSATPKLPFASSPIDTGTQRSQSSLPDLCRRCNKPGHFARDCALRFDIRHMTSDEREDWIEQLLASTDVATEEAPIAKLIAEEKEEKKEDF